MLVRLGAANHKTKRTAMALAIPVNATYAFNLPAGYTCPGANVCLSRADRVTGKVTDGPECMFRCFAASNEAYSPDLRRMVWDNLMALQECGEDSACIEDKLTLAVFNAPVPPQLIRVHVSGDFYGPGYVEAWRRVAKTFDGIRFYAYTKSLPYVLPRWLRGWPENFALTYSHGGKWDKAAAEERLSQAYVVLNEQQAAERNLPIDTDDTHAALNVFDDASKSFALLIHGTQPKGSRAALALNILRRAARKGKK